MKVQVVTTFSEAGYASYGKRFIETFLKNDPDSDLVAYHEHARPDLTHPRLYWRSLEEDQDRSQFIAMHGDDPEKVGTARDPNSQSIRFCHKVFAITNAIAQAELRPEIGWVVWMDADVTVYAKPRWEDILLNVDLAFLGRVDMPYTECGFVGYRNVAQVWKMAEDMRRYYMSGEMFTRPKSDWHDSRCFDICRQRSGVPTDRQLNLSDGVRGTHVWPLVPILNRWCQHQKGPRRKMAVYGSVVP